MLAADLAASGHVRINGQRVNAAGRAVKVGDVLTIALPKTVRVLKIVAFAERREGASAARRLYGGLRKPAEPTKLAATRGSPPTGTGRPTRRA
jgi:ribosome-associated heat shock protein Hsp15